MKERLQNIPDNFHGIYVGIVWKSCRVNNWRLGPIFEFNATLRRMADSAVHSSEQGVYIGYTLCVRAVNE